MAAPDDRPSSAVRRMFGRRVARDSAALAAGSTGAGLLAYAFFALATRSLGADGAAPVSVLWSYWTIAAAVLTFTVQHWTIRTLAHDGHEGTVAKSLPRIAALAGLLAALAGLVAFAFRQGLFNDGGMAYPAMVAAITIGSFFTGLVRGALAGRRRYVATAASLVAENVFRVLMAAGLAVGGGGTEAFGVALVVGPLTGLVWVSSLRFTHGPLDTPAVRNPLTLASGIAGGSLIAQTVLTSAPVVLAASGGAPEEITSLFLALAVWRAPYLVALGVTPQLTAVLTRFVLRGQSARVARVRALTVVGVSGASALAALAGLTVMQPILALAFGEDVEMDAWALAALGIGTAVALGNLVLLLMLLALGRSGVATGAWTLAVTVAAGWFAFSSLPSLSRVVLAFVAAQVTAFILLLVFSRRLPRDPS
jgi:O-antigen/teichoic acid export membrane protein